MQKPRRYRVHRARRYGLSEPHGEDCSEPHRTEKRAACAALLPMVRRDSDRDDASWRGVDMGETEEEMKEGILYYSRIFCHAFFTKALVMHNIFFCTLSHLFA